MAVKIYYPEHKQIINLIVICWHCRKIVELIKNGGITTDKCTNPECGVPMKFFTLEIVS